MNNEIDCDPQLTDDYIRRMLEYLQGWRVVSNKYEEPREYSKTYMGVNELDSLDTVNTITYKELEIFFQKGKIMVMNYIWKDYIPRDPIVHEALLQWTAGLIWKKYNIKPVEFRDGTTSYGYGDRLIGLAKKTLKNKQRQRLRSVV